MLPMLWNNYRWIWNALFSLEDVKTMEKRFSDVTLTPCQCYVRMKVFFVTFLLHSVYLFALRLMPYMFGLFHWGVCRTSKLGAMSKMKSCKIDRILWEMRAMSFVPFILWAYICCTRAHCTEILRNKTSCWISNSDAILEHLFFDIFQMIPSTMKIIS